MAAIISSQVVPRIPLRGHCGWPDHVHRSNRSPSPPNVSLSTQYTSMVWAAVSPKTKAERAALLHTCGPKCFLMPGTLKYPVCAALSKVPKTTRCEYHAAGARAALARAAEFHHPALVSRARRVLRKVSTSNQRGRRRSRTALRRRSISKIRHGASVRTKTKSRSRHR